MANINLFGLVELDQLGQMRPIASFGCAEDPSGLNVLGANELPLRQDFAFGKMLVTAQKRRPALRVPNGTVMVNLLRRT